MTWEESFDFLRQSIASHDRQISELIQRGAETGPRIRAVTGAIENLVAVTNQDPTAIRTLARIAGQHDKPISELENR